MKIKIVGELTPENRFKSAKLLLEDGQDLCSLLPIGGINFRWRPGELPEIELKIDPMVAEFDLLATVDVEDIVRQLHEIDSVKHKREKKNQ